MEEGFAWADAFGFGIVLLAGFGLFLLGLYIGRGSRAEPAKKESRYFIISPGGTVRSVVNTDYIATLLDSIEHIQLR